MASHLLYINRRCCSRLLRGDRGGGRRPRRNWFGGFWNIKDTRRPRRPWKEAHARSRRLHSVGSCGDRGTARRGEGRCDPLRIAGGLPPGLEEGPRQRRFTEVTLEGDSPSKRESRRSSLFSRGEKRSMAFTASPRAGLAKKKKKKENDSVGFPFPLAHFLGKKNWVSKMKSGTVFSGSFETIRISPLEGWGCGFVMRLSGIWLDNASHERHCGGRRLFFYREGAY